MRTFARVSVAAAMATVLTGAATVFAITVQAQGARLMENLGRGVVAVRSSSSSVLVSWRLLGLDPAGIGFNVYRSTAGGVAVKLNGSVLTGGTNYTDTTANLSQSNAYHVRPVVNGMEQAASGAFTLTSNHAVEPAVRVPLRAGARIKFVWVGDLDGDGEYDYVLDRQETQQKIEAYRSNGQFLWEVNMGPNSVNRSGIEIGSSAINAGHNDGVSVYDFDSDGRAEVAVRIANGVRFGTGPPGRTATTIASSSPSSTAGPERCATGPRCRPPTSPMVRWPRGSCRATSTAPRRAWSRT